MTTRIDFEAIAKIKALANHNTLFIKCLIKNVDNRYILQLLFNEISFASFKDFDIYVPCLTIDQYLDSWYLCRIADNFVINRNEQLLNGEPILIRIKSI